MFKKFVSIITVFAVLLAFTPVVAADTAPATPTVESILNNYHEKAFAAQAASDTTSYSPRSGDSALTLEQETVNELNAAGYEAYNVTSDNYDFIEEELGTDLSSLGITNNGSYIVVISGEDSTARSGSGRAIVPQPGDGGAGSSFVYSYEGVNYTMRYVTVTAAETGFHRSNYVDLKAKLTTNEYYDMLVSGIKAMIYQAVTDAINSLIGVNYLTPILDILQAIYTNTNFAEDDVLV